jgi:hypothetical protein
LKKKIEKKKEEEGEEEEEEGWLPWGCPATPILAEALGRFGVVDDKKEKKKKNYEFWPMGVVWPIGWSEPPLKAKMYQFVYLFFIFCGGGLATTNWPREWLSHSSYFLFFNYIIF